MSPAAGVEVPVTPVTDSDSSASMVTSVAQLVRLSVPRSASSAGHSSPGARWPLAAASRTCSVLSPSSEVSSLVSTSTSSVSVNAAPSAAQSPGATVKVVSGTAVYSVPATAVPSSADTATAKSSRGRGTPSAVRSRASTVTLSPSSTV